MNPEHIFSPAVAKLFGFGERALKVTCMLLTKDASLLHMLLQRYRFLTNTKLANENVTQHYQHGFFRQEGRDKSKAIPSVLATVLKQAAHYKSVAPQSTFITRGKCDSW